MWLIPTKIIETTIYNLQLIDWKINSFLAFRISFDWNIQPAKCQWCDFLWSFGNVIFIFNNDDISFNMEILPQKMQAKCQWCHFLYGDFYTVFGFDSCKNDCDNNKIYNFMRLMEKIKSFLAFRISFDWNVQQAKCQWYHFLWGLGNVIFIFNIKINKIYHFI